MLLPFAVKFAFLVYFLQDPFIYKFNSNGITNEKCIFLIERDNDFFKNVNGSNIVTIIGLHLYQLEMCGNGSSIWIHMYNKYVICLSIKSILTQKKEPVRLAFDFVVPSFQTLTFADWLNLQKCDFVESSIQMYLQQYR